MLFNYCFVAPNDNYKCTAWKGPLELSPAQNSLLKAGQLQEDQDLT